VRFSASGAQADWFFHATLHGLYELMQMISTKVFALRASRCSNSASRVINVFLGHLSIPEFLTD
jgi:hypothetical protein